MNPLFVILGCMVIANQVPTILFIPIRWIKTKLNKRRLKPFDCEACLSLWLTLSASLVLGTNILVAILSGACAFGMMVGYQFIKLKQNDE